MQLVKKALPLIIAWFFLTVSGSCHAELPLVLEDGQTERAAALIVVPDNAEPIALYAAEELAWHVEQATGVRLSILPEAKSKTAQQSRVYLGATKAAAKNGIDVNAMAAEACVLRTVGDDLFIVGKDGPGDPLSIGHTYSGTLWGVYELLEKQLGVHWLWPGELGTDVPKQEQLVLQSMDETILPKYIQRQLRPSLGPRGFAVADDRLAFSEKQREQYAHRQKVFLRRHRMGRSPNTYFSERRFGSGHSFHGWWEKYGEEHPEWFQQLPDESRGPADPRKPQKVSMCVSNPGLHRKIVELWAAEREKRPGRPLGLGVGENDGSARCQCEQCLAWDGETIDPETLPPGLERSFLPVQASSRYARLAQEVYALAVKIDPEVKVHTYAYLNYFWAPHKNVKLNSNVVVGFVPWFRWAGWFPRTDAEQEWIKQQWLGWQKTGASLYYRPNWFLDGYSMPHVYVHQFADAFQFYHRHGMIGTDFDSLQGMWAAQGPNLYVLPRIHVRPESQVDELLDEYFEAFGPAQQAVKDYFDYWEQYSTNNSQRAADAIRTRRDGYFRRYAHYAVVADELYPPEVFEPAFELLDKARAACKDSENPLYASRVEFLREGLEHSRMCVLTAAVLNDPQAAPEQRGQALEKLAAYRKSVEHLGIANMDRAAIIETDSWKDVAGFADPWPQAK